MNIQDIAKLAGVSASTVSKVMNGKDKDISEETRKKVLKVIEKEKLYSIFQISRKSRNEKSSDRTYFKNANRERENIILTVEKKAKTKGIWLAYNYAETDKRD